MVSCGTSWHAALIGKQLIEMFCRIPVEVAYASEFRYSDPVVGPGDVVFALSQSGETADTLSAIQMAKEKGAMIFGIVNAVGSSIARASDTGTYIHVGPEIGVASTKAFTGQTTVLAMLALAIGREKGTVDENTYNEAIEELQSIPDKISSILEKDDETVVGAPYVTGASVKAEVVETGKAKKVVIYKYKAKKDSKKKQGHRQPYTQLKIKSIGVRASRKKAEEPAEAAE